MNQPKSNVELRYIKLLYLDLEQTLKTWTTEVFSLSTQTA